MSFGRLPGLSETDSQTIKGAIFHAEPHQHHHRSGDMSGVEGNRRWLALIVLYTTIVNVALPSIRQDLGFTETSLAWVVNAYLLTFGGFLLLGGRLGDL